MLHKKGGGDWSNQGMRCVCHRSYTFRDYHLSQQIARLWIMKVHTDTHCQLSASWGRGTMCTIPCKMIFTLPCIYYMHVCLFDMYLCVVNGICPMCCSVERCSGVWMRACGLSQCPVPWWIHWSRWGSCFQLPVWLWARCWAVSPGQRCVPCGLTYDSPPRETEDTHLCREGEGWRWYKKEHDEDSHGEF